MKVLLVLAAVIGMWATPLAHAAVGQKAEQAATQVCTLKVSGMTCAGCEAAVRMAARSVDGVTDVKVSYAKGNADVTYDPTKTTPDVIAKVITSKSGFKAETTHAAGKK